jgi:hypothetical protein
MVWIGITHLSGGMFASIEGPAKIVHWSEVECMQVAVLKLVDAARTFYCSCQEQHRDTASWQSFKANFRERLKDIRTDQFHYMQLQTARQRRNERPQEFADRCRALAQKIVDKAEDPQVQHAHQQNAERMLLVAFISGLSGVPGRQCRFSNPQTIQQALSIALTVEQAENQERPIGSFYTKYEKTVRLLPRHANDKKRDEENSARRMKNSPGRENPSARSKSQGVRLNPGQ